MRACLLLGLVFLVALTGCDNNEDALPARVRVVHAASATGLLDFFIDFELFTRDLSFRQASPYVEWEPGLRRLEVRATASGQTITASREVLLDADQAYTVLLTGTAGAASLVLLEDDRSTPPAGQARIRIAHGAPQAATVAVSVTPAAGGSAVLDVPSLGFGAASERVLVEAGAYDVLASFGSSSAALTAEMIEAGRRYLAVVAHAGNTSALSLFLVVDG